MQADIQFKQLQNADDLAQFGGKAKNLAKMLQAGLPVPGGFAVGLNAFDKQGKLSQATIHNIQRLDQSKLYAVRSSASGEDAENASWAGQFETYLNTMPVDVAARIEDCHNSAETRAKAYASEKGQDNGFDIAVVVQEMVKADFAGVMFTRDPSDGSNKIPIEYVRGLGESLVHGDVDPERVIWSRNKRKVLEQSEKDVPVPIDQLVKLAEKIECTFGLPQDIEWAYQNGQVWIVQSRPITTLQERGTGKHYLGDSGKLFYWGPSRAKPLYMSDFLSAEEKFFADMYTDEAFPKPPKTIVLFHEDKMVWLNKAKEFESFVTALFAAYEKADRLQKDWGAWRTAVQALDNYAAAREVSLEQLARLFDACWQPTLFAEFSLYGAEIVIAKRLERFDEKTRQKIWGTMTLPDKPTFMQQVDMELAMSKDPRQLAKRYPWIQDGYSGVYQDTEAYFAKRMTVVAGNTQLEASSADKRQTMIDEYKLSNGEVLTLNLARNLAEFMDERKSWMMRTRRYIAEVAKGIATANQSTLVALAKGKTTPYFGWSYLQGNNIMLDKQDVSLAWDWYVEFRAAKSVLKGIVASSGGQHFINGEVKKVDSPTDAMPDDMVLVVPSTSPSYVPLMRKARALITDHGGMMSHAAIVAREFGLPCIVGTKQATKVLKDGDKVVLDLVKGEISR